MTSLNELRRLEALEPEPLKKMAYREQVTTAEKLEKAGTLEKRGVDIELPLSPFFSIAIHGFKGMEEQGHVNLSYTQHGMHDPSGIDVYDEDPEAVANEIADKMRPHAEAIGQIWKEAKAAHHEEHTYGRAEETEAKGPSTEERGKVAAAPLKKMRGPGGGPVDRSGRSSRATAKATDEASKDVAELVRVVGALENATASVQFDYDHNRESFTEQQIKTIDQAKQDINNAADNLP